jgi:hypothetical protein
MADGNDAESPVERKRLYEEHVGLVRENQNTMSDEFDKNLLALSSGALGVSLAFIKDIVPSKMLDFAAPYILLG